MFKTCNRCKENKTLECFHVLKRGKYGRNSICIECRKKKKSESNYENITEIKCNLCKEIKSNDLFYKNTSSKTGYQSYCKDCQRKNIVISGSKLDNFINNLYKRFINKYSDKNILFNQNDILRKYNEQNGKCAITGHKMTHIVDFKRRIDNIWNISIFFDESLPNYDYNSFYLVINMVYSVKKIYKLENKTLLNVYDELSNNI